MPINSRDPRALSLVSQRFNFLGRKVEEFLGIPYYVSDRYWANIAQV